MAIDAIPEPCAAAAAGPGAACGQCGQPAISRGGEEELSQHTRPAMPGPGDARPAVASGISLRAKGLLAFGLLALYLIVSAIVVETQRQRLFAMVNELDAVHRDEEALGRVSYSLSQAIIVLNEAQYAPGQRLEVAPVLLAAETVQAGFNSLSKRFPELGAQAREIGTWIGALASSRQREVLLDMREALHRSVTVLDAATAGVRQRKATLSSGYRISYDATSILWIGLGAFGIIVFGAAIMRFFTRLVWDVRDVQSRALEIVKGYRGPAMGVTRADEVGALMRSVNLMQDELREREAALELSRQERFHHDKMAAVGSIAAQVAHEINNPISAIAGVAQAISDVKGLGHCPHHGEACQPQLILDQARRISVITRQLSDFGSPKSAELQLLDVNGLVGSTVAFLRYDRRFRSVAVELELDRQLPAVMAVGDHLAQVLMNLLINAADAVAEANVKGRLTVATRQRDGEVLVTVADNGKGMDAATKARAFDDYFTTKPAGKGSGLGLALCRRLMRGAGGEVELESLPGVGTTVALRIPLERTAEAPQALQA